MAPAQSKNVVSPAYPKANALKCCKRRSWLLRICDEFTDGAERCRLSIAFLALLTSSATNLAFPTIMGRTIDVAIKADSKSVVRSFFITVAGIFGIGALASWIRVYAFNLSAHRIEQRMRKALFRVLLSQDTQFMSAQRMGDIHTRLLEDVSTVSKSLTVTLAQGLRGLNSTIGGTSMLLALCPQLTFVTLSLVPFIGLGAIAYRRRVKRLTRDIQDSLANAVSQGEERLSNLETVRLFGMEMKEVSLFNKCLDALYPYARSVCSADGLLMAGLSLTVNTALVTVLYFGGALVRQGKLSMGRLTSFAIYSSMVGLGCSSLSGVYGNIIKASASADRIFTYLDRPCLPCSGATLQQVSGKISFDNVGFVYSIRPDAVIFKNLSFSIPAGNAVGLVGSSGSGKTTVARLLTRLLDPLHGVIRLDGYDIASLDPVWLRQNVFGVVNQEPVLFDMSIAGNIAYANPNATQEEIEHAARRANAHDFISALPEGYDTRVGERGTQLSVGQKQRIAIARAVLKNPPCLILDEATASLDPESSGLVRDALFNLMHGRTVLVITHDVNFLRSTQHILLMEHGEVVHTGTFHDLKKKAPQFSCLLQHNDAS